MTYVVRIRTSHSASDWDADFVDLRLMLITFASLTMSSFPCHRNCMRLELFYRCGTRGVSFEDLSASPRARYEVPTFWTLRRNSIPRCWISTIYLLDTVSLFFLRPSLVFQSMSVRCITSTKHLNFLCSTWRIHTFICNILRKISQLESSFEFSNLK